MSDTTPIPRWSPATSTRVGCRPSSPTPTRSCCSARPATSRYASCSRRSTDCRSSGVLSVPVIGVARSDWTDDDFRRHARESIDEHIDDADHRRRRLAVRTARPRAGRLRRRGDLERTAVDARPGRLAGCRVLHGDPADDVPDGRDEAGVRRSPPAGPHRRREAVRPRPPVGDRAEQDAPRGVLGGPHLPHRPLPRQGGGRGPPGVPLRQHAARAGVEPQLRPQRAGHDVGDDRRRGTRVVLRRGRRDPRRAAEPPPAGGVAARDGASRRLRLGLPAGREGQGDRGDATDRHRALVRGQYVGYRDEPGVDPNSKVETFAAVRLEIDSWRWAGVPWYVRVGKALAQNATEAVIELARAAADAVRRVRRSAPGTQPDPAAARRERRCHVRAPGQDARPAISTARTSTSTSTSPLRSANVRTPTSACSAMR